MRLHAIPVAASLLLLFAAAGCGSDTSGAGGPGGTSGSGGAGGGGDPCAGLACGDPCTACPDGESCMPQACNADGMCVDAQLAACGACPAALPKKDDPCDVVELVCEFDTDIRLPCRRRATCKATGWEPLDPGCMSFPVDDPKCPEAQPSAGACDVMTDAPLCVYGEPFCGCTACAMGGPCGSTGEWVCAAPPSPPCPAIAPKLGAPCSDDKLSCVYGSCALGGTSGGRTCEGGVWTEDIVNCPL